MLYKIMQIVLASLLLIAVCAEFAAWALKGRIGGLGWLACAAIVLLAWRLFLLACKDLKGHSTTN